MRGFPLAEQPAPWPVNDVRMMYAIGLDLGTLLNWIHLKNRTGTITMLNRFAGGVSYLYKIFYPFSQSSLRIQLPEAPISTITAAHPSRRSPTGVLVPLKRYSLLSLLYLA